MRRTGFLLAAAAALALGATTPAQEHDVSWYEIGGGGGTSTGGGYEVHGTIGAPDGAAPADMTGGGYTFTVGFWAAPANPPCLADLSDNGTVDFADILAVIGAWGACPPDCPEDLSGNGVVDFADILAIIGAWGPCP
ncbi:MAG: hypothetical protein GY715_15295 [Planctomycetes bacterium]|nr:hypothetical protein [Planctomycetota bacterium]